MKRMTLLAALFVLSTATLAQAQVIGTYRPSLVTYYPSTSSVTPVAYHKPVPANNQAYAQYASNTRTQVAYAPNNYTTTNYASYPVNTVANTQVVSSVPVQQASYYNGTPYVANYPQQVTYSPIVGNDCCNPCQPIQTVAYQAPVQTIAYQQPVAPVQPIATTAQPGYIDGKWYVGKGLLGRPKLYAEGQPIRNAFRTILP